MNVYWIKKITLGVLCVGACALSARYVFQLSPKASAGFWYFYPHACQGSGVSAADNAEGAPTTKEMSGVDEYTVQNSAIIAPQQGNSLDCTSFSGEQTKEKITRLRLVVQWAFKAAPPPPPSAETKDTDTDKGQEKDTEEKKSPPKKPTEQPDTDKLPAPDPTPAPESNPPPTPAPVESKQQQEPAPRPAEQTAPAPAPEAPTQAFLYKTIWVPVARAQETEIPTVASSLVFNGLDHFIDIQYAVGNEPWTSFDNPQLELPFRDPKDIDRLKIRIKSLAKDATLPDVYVDGMWLEIKSSDDQPATQPEDEQNKDSNTGEESASLLDTVSDFFSSAKDAVVDFLTPDDHLAPQPETATQSQPIQTQPTPAPTPIVPASVLEVANTAAQTLPSEQVQWKTTSQELSDAKAHEIRNDKISVIAENESLKISGECSLAYATILLFSNKTDFQTDPAKALFNQAVACQNGRFDGTLPTSKLSQNLESGTYYLLVAQQEPGKPWQPTSAFIAVTLNRVLKN